MLALDIAHWRWFSLPLHTTAFLVNKMNIFCHLEERLDEESLLSLWKRVFKVAMNISCDAIISLVFHVTFKMPLSLSSQRGCNQLILKWTIKTVVVFFTTKTRLLTTAVWKGVLLRAWQFLMNIHLYKGIYEVLKVLGYMYRYYNAVSQYVNTIHAHTNFINESWIIDFD